MPSPLPLLAALLTAGDLPPPEALPPLRTVRQLPARAQQRSVVLRAQRLEGQLGAKLRLTGDVELRHGDTLLRAPELNYDEAQDLVQSEGRVSIEHLGNQMQGHGLRLQLDRFVGELLEPHYRLSLTGGSGRAARIDFLGDERLRAEEASYSSCPREDDAPPAWELRTRKLDLNLPANEGRAEGAVLRFQGVPILAAPEFSFPLTDERKSGWLPPHFGADNRGGVEFTLPHYFNLAPNYDATVAPFVMTRRGFGVDAELRGLQSWGGASLNASLLPHDRVAGERRWLWRALADAEPWQGARLEAQAESVSDNDVWKDLRRRINSPTPRLLGRDLRAEQRFSLLGGDGLLYARAQGWQVLQTAEADTQITAPYQRAPQLGLSLQRSADSLPLQASLALEYNRFTLPSQALAAQDPGGERVHASASLALPLSGAAWWLTPQLAATAAEYRLERATQAGQRRLRRSLPTASLDAGMVLERDTRLAGRPMLQTLEPRLLYVHTPFRDQAQLPLYDTAPLDFNVESLFATNAFSGVDRIADAQQLSFGGTSRWLDPATGEEQLRLGLVQRYQFRPQRVTPDAGTVNQRFSDLLLAGAAHLREPWWLDAALQFNPDSERLVRSVARVRYSPGEHRTVSLAYRLTRNQSEQLDLAWQWPLAGGKRRVASGGDKDCRGAWYSAGRIQYSLRDSRITDSLVGLEYDAGCWVLRMGVERLSTGLAEANTRFLLQLELVGLSRLGSNALKVLRDNVPGYRPLASDSGLSSLP
ncbi:MAG: LPS-assembly protein LptD [Burkholderiales bacterium]|uniref:LPS-assembly protein LptD n=1 Tax=Inhella sp. TaxID=1921806 RepID=UPI001ACA90B5|nr:LPS-assembly protein LptD [Burkholderiales bacterium]